MRRMGGVIVAACLLAALPGAAQGQARGQVGGPPTMKYDRTDGGDKKRSEPIVIGRDAGPLGPIEVVGQPTQNCLIVTVDVPRERTSSGGCGGFFDEGRAIEMASSFFTGYLPGRAVFSGYSGPGTPDAASVVVSTKGRGKPKQRRAILAEPDAAILQRLRLTEPFAYWAIVIPGCVSHRNVRLRALDAAGATIGRNKAWGVGSCGS